MRIIFNECLINTIEFKTLSYFFMPRKGRIVGIITKSFSVVKIETEDRLNSVDKY